MSTPGSKAWAHKLVAEYESGEGRRPLNVYRVAYEALERRFPEGAPPASRQKNVQVCSGAQPVARPVPVPKTPPITDGWWDQGSDE
ncbi:hypothetical protein [Paraburkholderia antibiotica]|uniref:Uncharacterized protein n=1 Tax=Paraburkholderia antibiotica TaxID=2728839 RepID=A0A7Y0FFV3_9BURK|nr:hypothetical protein [Paraburkholderia antibiotica]NML34532.1 hypothetical protein [Paraburkholderia antibiotica]